MSDLSVANNTSEVKSQTSSITIWLDNHPENPEDYDTDILSIANADNKTKHKRLHAQHEELASLGRRRKLGELSTSDMNTGHERGRRSPRKNEKKLPNSSIAKAKKAVNSEESEASTKLPEPTTPPRPAQPQFLNQDVTPRPKSLSLIPQPNLSYSPLMETRSAGGEDTASPTRSESETFSSGDVASSRGRRARSPVKRMGDFKLSNTWVEMKEFGIPEYPIPTAAKMLCRDLRRINMGRGLIPRSIANEAMGYLEDIEFDDLAFADIKEESIEGSLGHEAMWTVVLDILEAARECRSLCLPEASWNSEVHSPLLRCALRGNWKSQEVWYRDITTAQIQDTSLLPVVGAGSNTLTMQAKMVDYALIIESSGVMQSRILSTLRVEGKPSINHTNTEHIRFTPIAVSIETKRGAIDEDSANVQLSVWVSAHFARLRQLSQGKAKLPILPLVVIQGHDWKMMVAEAKGDGRIIILRDLRLGATDTVLGIYQLISSVRRLARWVNEEYKPWLESHALSPVEVK
jgi:hypothetical protein